MESSSKPINGSQTDRASADQEPNFDEDHGKVAHLWNITSTFGGRKPSRKFVMTKSGLPSLFKSVAIIDPPSSAPEAKNARLNSPVPALNKMHI
jgi:hypothetical protein